jgi:hypothetical protein
MDAFDVVNPAKTIEEIKSYIEDAKKKWKLTREEFRLTTQAYKAVTMDDLDKLRVHYEKINKPELAKMLEPVFLIGEGSSTHVLMMDTSQRKEKSFAITARRTDGKYDLLIIECSQIKKIGWDKAGLACTGCIAFGLIAAIVAATGGLALPAVCAVGAGAAALPAAQVTSAGISEYNKPLDDRTTAFMLKEMVDKKVLTFEGGELKVLNLNSFHSTEDA